MDIKVSVIVPVYNVENYIEQALNSLLGQTLSDLEIIAVDDGSSDKSGEILDQYAQEYPQRIEVLHIQNSGAGNARNEGLKRAKGKYIGFLDSDDWVAEDMYETLYNKAEKGYDIVVCNLVRTCFENDLQEREVKAYGGMTPISTKEFIKRAYNTASPCNKLFSRHFLEMVNLNFPEIPYEDFGFVPVLMTYASKVAYIDAKLYYYRARINSITSCQTYDDAILHKIEAYEYCLRNCNQEKREYLLYALINKLNEDISAFSQYEWYFKQYLKSLLNEIEGSPYLQSSCRDIKFDKRLSDPGIPPLLHIFCIGRTLQADRLLQLKQTFPQFAIKIWDETNFKVEEFPFLKKALKKGCFDYINDYAKLEVLYHEGGIAIDPIMELNKRFTSCMKYRLVFGAECPDKIHTYVIAAFPKQDFLLNLITTYYFCPYTDELLPLSLRVRDCLYALGQLKISGKFQMVDHMNLAILAPSQLLYPMDIKRSWGSYCGEPGKKALYRQYVCSEYCDIKENGTVPNKTIKELQNKINAYQRSTCWRITRPVRIVGDILKRMKG